MARRTLNRLSAKEAERLKNAGTSFRWWRSLSVHRWRRPAALVFLYVRRGRRVELGLGGGRDMALASARTQATGLRAMLANGEDPRAARARNDSVTTFGRCANAYVKAMHPCRASEASSGGQLCTAGELDSWEIARNLLKLQGRFCPRLGKNYS